MSKSDVVRCDWGSDGLMVEYHDNEWGVPSYDSRHLFELLTLEGAQAGLSWATILKKRDGYKRAFRNFDVAKVAKFNDADIERLLEDASIVRNRLKVESTIANARAILDVGDFVEFVWELAGGKPVINRWTKQSQLPAKTAVSEAMSKELKRNGFRFVGPTVCYSFMQASGMVNDHLTSCFRYRKAMPNSYQ